MTLMAFGGLVTAARHHNTDTGIAVKDYMNANDESIIDFLEITQDDFGDSTSTTSDLYIVKIKKWVYTLRRTFIPSKLKK